MSPFSHHAYLVPGGRNVVSALLKQLQDLGVSITANPDFKQEHYENLGVNEARAIKDHDLRQPIGERKVFVISYDGITREAQNALLKTFEEPSGNSHYFLCVDKETEILPTLRSRLLIYTVGQREELNKEEVVNFVKMRLDERLVFCHEFAEDIKKDRRSKRDAEVFLNGLEEYLFQKMRELPKDKIKDFLEIKGHIQAKGSSVKNILESISIILPIL